MILPWLFYPVKLCFSPTWSLSIKTYYFSDQYHHLSIANTSHLDNILDSFFLRYISNHLDLLIFSIWHISQFHLLFLTFLSFFKCRLSVLFPSIIDYHIWLYIKSLLFLVLLTSFLSILYTIVNDLSKMSSWLCNSFTSKGISGFPLC